MTALGSSREAEATTGLDCRAFFDESGRLGRAVQSLLLQRRDQ